MSKMSNANGTKVWHGGGEQAPFSWSRLANLLWKLDNNCITQEGYAELRSLEALIPPEEPDPEVYGMFADC